MYPFSTPLKTSENLTVFWYFQEVEKGCTEKKWVKMSSNKGVTLGNYLWKNLFTLRTNEFPTKHLLLETSTEMLWSSLISKNINLVWKYLHNIFLQGIFSWNFWSCFYDKPEGQLACLCVRKNYLLKLILKTNF